MSRGKPKMVNIGTPERPAMIQSNVLGKAQKPKSQEGHEWWEMVANGSVAIKPRVLDRLVQITNEKKGL